MIKINNPLGCIQLTNDYFAELVGEAAKSCFGVAGMATGPRARDTLKNFVMGSDCQDKGVLVIEHNGELDIQLHIKTTYGLNIASMTKSVTHKVKYAVEEATGLSVRRIDVCVDDII